MNDPAPDPLPFEALETSVSGTGVPRTAVPRTAVPPRPEIEIRRSPRRRRTVSAHREGDRIVVAVPARMSRAETARMVDELVARVLAREAGATPTDHELTQRAQRLSAIYLRGRAVPASVRWVDTMSSRWASCTPLDRSIRLSRRLQGMPEYVVDYVLLHELAHLLVPGPGPAFWAELAGYERLERARGYLEGFDAASG
ncbi:MAG: M48 metallopeptidase family protein [Mycobacteriales bacterium]